MADEEVIISVKNNPEVTKGDSLTATIEINQVTDLSSFQFNISFNPEILSLENVAVGQVGGTSLPVRHIEIEDGDYLVRFQSEEAVSGAGNTGNSYLPGTRGWKHEHCSEKRHSGGQPVNAYYRRLAGQFDNRPPGRRRRLSLKLPRQGGRIMSIWFFPSRLNPRRYTSARITKAPPRLLRGRLRRVI
jgi:hypothetical protein